MTTKKAAHEFGYDHEYIKNPGNWREGEGLSLNLRMVAGDPKAYKEKLRQKIGRMIEEKKDCE